MKTVVNIINKIMAVIAVVLLIIFLAFDKISDIITPLNIFIDRGVFGPFSTGDINELNHLYMELLPDIEPEKQFYLLSIFCPKNDLGYTSTIRLRRRGTSEIVYYQQYNFAPNQRVCGAATFSIVLPATVPNGSYRLERYVSFNNSLFSFYRFYLLPLDIEVRRH